MESDKFDWYKGSEDTVIIKQVDAVAVYTNPDMDIVIRQRDPMGDDDSAR